MMDQLSTVCTKYPDQMPIWHLQNASFPDQQNEVFDVSNEKMVKKNKESVVQHHR